MARRRGSAAALREWGKPRPIARAVLYFSCEDSAGITGTSLVVDGGYIATAEWETARPTKFERPQ